MTTDKAFKRVVRARMARTGERYAAARRSLIDAGTAVDPPAPSIETVAGTHYRLRGGLHPETATLANVLANGGVVSGLTGRPLTEATILGIGGGLGAGYILWEFKSRISTILTLGFRNRWQYPSAWTARTLGRLGIEPDVHETGGAAGARRALDIRLDAGSPVIAQVDLQTLGTWGLPEALSGVFGHTLVIVGRGSDGTYLVDDRGRAPFRIAPDVMAAARGRTGSYGHRIVALPTTEGPIPADRVRAAMWAGLEDQVDHLRSTSESFSLPAWRKWARMMTDERNAKAWPRVFADGHGLFGALLGLVEAVDANASPWGGHLRDLYATSLDEAAVALDRPALGDAARAWRAAADAARDRPADPRDRGRQEELEAPRPTRRSSAPRRAWPQHGRRARARSPRRAARGTRAASSSPCPGAGSPPSPGGSAPSPARRRRPGWRPP